MKTGGQSRWVFPPVPGGVIGMNCIKTDYIVFILRIGWTPLREEKRLLDESL
jgi:hypothetical protein